MNKHVRLLADRYANCLTEGDIVELYRTLEERYGVGLGSAAVSDGNKVFLLEKALEEFPVDTLEFIARKMLWRTKEALELLLEYIRKRIAEENAEIAREFVKRLEAVVEDFSTPVTEYLREEISSVEETLRTKSVEVDSKQ